MRRKLIPLFLVLLAGCSSTPALQDVPCQAPAAIPAQIDSPAEFPAAIQSLSDYLKQHSTRPPATPPG